MKHVFLSNHVLVTWLSKAVWNGNKIPGNWYFEWDREPGYFYLRVFGLEVSVTLD